MTDSTTLNLEKVYEEEEFGMATGGEPKEKDLVTDKVTKEEHKLLEAIRLLGIQPKIDSPEVLLKLSQTFGKSTTGELEFTYKGTKSKLGAFDVSFGTPYCPGAGKRSRLEEGSPFPKLEPKDSPFTKTLPKWQPLPTMTDSRLPKTEVKGGHYSFPKLSTFYGDEGKGEVNWQTFKYEVDSLVSDGVFSEQQILLGIRRGLKGSASDVVRRLGPGVSVRQVIAKLDSAYGSIESRESIMKKFYTCTQKTGESVEVYASRLEEYFGQAVGLGALRKSDTEVLKEKLYGGLKTELKQTARYQCDKIKEYDEFKRELRKLEAELKESHSPERRPSKAAVNVERENPEMKQMKELLEKLNARIDVLEKEKETSSYYRIGGNRFKGRGSQLNRGRGAYRPQRPTGGTTFQPTCFHCNRKGHLKRDCPQLSAGITCFKCKETGHFQRNCPKA